MPLDKVIISHLEEQDILEDKIQADIEALLMTVDVKDLIADAEGVLLSIVDTLQAKLKNSYYSKSAENGIRLAKRIEEDGDIKITDSNDPNMNEGILDDNG